MKKLVYILIAISLFHYFAYGQWIQQTSGVTTSLLDIDLINENTGWACGDGGVVVKTTNGGINWVQQTTGTLNRLEGIDAVDANTVYCVGFYQTILKSTNGGNNWIIIRAGVNGVGSNFFKTYFINQNTGWLLRSGGGYVLRTSNGGTTFDSTFTNHSFNRDIYFKDAINGVLCGDGAWVMKSTDGGITWYQISLPLLLDAPNLYRLSFVGDVGWTIGEGDNSGLGKLVFRTTNFGSNWDSVGRVQYPSNNLNYSVFFSNNNTGYAGGTNGYLFKSTNGGLNWYQQDISGGGFRRDFNFINDSLGWVVGGGGQIFKTTNGGTYVGILPISNNIPKEFKLYQNYPNPFNPKTVIKYEIREKSYIKINLYNIQGKLLKTLVDKENIASSYEVLFDAGNFTSGIYFYRLFANGIIIDTKIMILVK